MKCQNTNMLRITSIFLAILFFGLMSASFAHAESYTFVKQWGSYGSSNGQFNYPNGIAVDNSGNVYVVDTGNNRIQKFDSNGNFITKWGTVNTYEYLPADGQFWNVNDISVDKSDNIYVADSGNSRIQKFDSKGNFITKWNTYDPYFLPSYKFLANCDCVAVNSLGNAYVIILGYVNIYSITGNFIGYWDYNYFPTSIAIDSSNNIYFANLCDITTNTNPKYGIIKCDGNGNIIAKWGPQGTGDGQLSNPEGIAVDSSGNIYVSDSGNDRIQKFDSKGNFITKWGSSGTYGYGQFNGPKGIAVDNSGNVYVVDHESNLIQKFAPTKSPVSPRSNFTSNVKTGNAPLSVQFTDTSTGSPTSWSWSFGDGTTSTLQNPSHTYSSAGTYTVTLTTTNGAGSNTFSKSNYIIVTVVPSKLVAGFSASPTSGTTPFKVTFSDTSTGSPTSWYWNFGDGSTSIIKNPVHVYTEAGKYTVTLTVKNAAGSNTSTKPSYIVVTAPIKPVAAFSATPLLGIAPLTVKFADNSKNNPSSWSWKFGDGSTSTIQNPKYKYTRKGTYTVTLIVKNAAGSSSITKSKYITVK